ncbi:MAG: hypothetical protein LBS24_07315 [Clostridiales Family XIII bacterium]|jgi:hypothetical protein|nr:hypothetical protein [Clostridiales Family XIII bacterium]
MAASKYFTHALPRFREIQSWLWLGSTEAEIAKALGVSVTSLNRYKAQFPEFRELLLRSKSVADSDAMHAAHDMSNGFVREVQKPFRVRKVIYDDKGRKREEFEEVVTVTVNEFFPPQHAANKFWLMNRMRKYWSKDSETEERTDESYENLLERARLGEPGPLGIDVLNPDEYIPAFLRIRTKEGGYAKLLPNPPQTRLRAAIRAAEASGAPVRIVILKARQMGFSTYTEAEIFHRAVTGRLVRASIIAHSAEATANLYEMTRRFYDGLPDELRPSVRASNAREIVFDAPLTRGKGEKPGPGLGSRIRCLTAGNATAGRSDTLTCLHVSEYAFWEGKGTTTKAMILQGVLQSVPAIPRSMIVIESTANGYDEFKDLWDDASEGISGYVPLFFPWHEMPEYTMAYTGFELTAEERELKAKHGLSNDRLEWRRQCIKTNCNNDSNVFRQEYPSTPEEAFIITGSPVFDAEKITARLDELRHAAPLASGRFAYRKKNGAVDPATVKWTDDERGEIRLFERPEERTPYVVGGDTAGEGSDFFTGVCLNAVTMRQAATLKHQYDEDLYAEQMFCLGMFYNRALLAPEINFSVYPVKVLQRMGYPRLFVRMAVGGMSEKAESKFGFRTDAVTRPMIIAELTEYVREHAELISDRAVLREMLDFVRNDKGRPEAREGRHDDLVIAYAIAVHVRQYQSQKLFEDAPEETDGLRAIAEYGL